MSLYKIANLEDQIMALKGQLKKYMGRYGYDLSKPINCLNPSHDDRHPSMSYFVDNEGIPKLHCFGCNTSLDVFNCAHILHHKPISGPGFIDDTIVHVAEIVDLKLEMQQMSQEDIHKLTLYNLYKAVADYIVSCPMSQLQLNELEKRKWVGADLAKVGIGCCNDLEMMREHLKNLGYGTKLLDDNEFNNSRLFSPNNLLFTLYDEYGKPNGFAGRNLIYDGVKDAAGIFINGPKFINVKKSSIYSKKDSMYLFHLASKKTSQSLYIVEGYADAVSAHLRGASNVCALSMLGISDSQLNMCKRHGVYDVVICLDNDEPGMNKAKEILDTALQNVHDLRIRFVFLPSKEVSTPDGIITLKVDPDEFIRDNGVEAFFALPKVDPFTWRLNQFIEDGDEYDPEAICLAMIPIIATEPSSVKRDSMIKELADFTSFNEKAIRDDIDKILNATDQKIQRAKESIISDLVQTLTEGGSSSAESILASAMDKLSSVSKQYDVDIFESSTRMSKLLAIKQYQESEELHTLYDFGQHFRTMRTICSGDMRQKLLVAGGIANSGKTSNFVDISLNLVNSNPNTMSVFLTIDDSSKEIVPRLICYDMCSRLFETDIDMFNYVNINKVASPYLYKDDFEYESFMEQRDISYRRIFSLFESDRYVLLDSEDGRTLEFFLSIVKYYTQKYPDKHIFFFLDNMHKLIADGKEDGRFKFAFISSEIKYAAVTNDCTIISTVEYNKVPPDRPPCNNDIAETKSIEYDVNAIFHFDNPLHRRRDTTLDYFWSYDGQKYPIICQIVGKNKIASYKANVYYKFYPDKAFYQEISEAEYKNLTEANKQLNFQNELNGESNNEDKVF